MNVRDTSLGGERKAFPQTVGMLIERASDGAPEGRQEALQELCRSYWKPVYYSLRVAWAKSNEDAKELTQAFFLWVFETNPLKRYARERGTFRAFLKSLLRHFVQHHDEALGRLKRGGDLKFLRLEDEGDRLESIREQDPEKAFDAGWRRILIEGAVGRVASRYRGTEKEVRFRVFERYDMVAPADRPSYEALANRLGLRSTDVHNYLVRVRGEIREEIRSELSQTTRDSDQMEEEWREFFAGP